jgi:hypothetical protein
MRKSVLLLLFILSTHYFVYSQVSIGIRGGVNLSAMAFESASRQKSGGLGSGNELENLQADVLLNVPLYGGLYLQPVFGYVTKGTLFKSSGIPQTTSARSGEYGSTVKVHYIEMPVNLLYKFRLSGCKLVIGAGPYAAYAIKGNYRTDVMENGNVVAHNKRALAFDNTDNLVTQGMYLSRWDAGINTTAGIELNSMVTININYSKGFMNLDNSSAYKVKNSSLGITIGILFDREDY